MTTISIGDAIGEGFGLIRRRPLAILGWGLARVAFTAATLSLMAPFYLETFRAAAARASGGAAAAPPDLSSMMAMQGASWLSSIVGMFLGAVLSCAVWRAVLHPERRQFAYLRVGAPELFMFLLTFGFGIVLVVGLLILALPIALIAGIAFAAHAAAVGVILAVLGGFAVLALLVWAFCRFSLVGPMMVQDGKFHLGDAWALTKGHAGTLFAVAILLIVILVALEMVIAAIGLAVGVAFLGQAAGGLSHVQTFFAQPPEQLLASVTPALIVVGLVSIPVTGAFLAILSAPWARIYRDLAQPDVAATFT
ncbi:MAG TPA: hypothetical protein VIJ59_01695 [Caulobacteraceae bacterium]